MDNKFYCVTDVERQFSVWCDGHVSASGRGRVKRCVLSLLMLVVSASVAFGQSDHVPSDHGYNLYGQLFGTSIGAGVGFDSRFKTGGVLGYSAGIAYTSISWSDDLSYSGSYRDVDSKGVCIPFEVNAILGKRASKLEFGLGFTTYLINRDETSVNRAVLTPDNNIQFGYLETTNHRSVFRPNIVGTISVGYRLQRKSGFFMKLGLTLHVGDLKCSPIDGVVPLPNLCLGYTIPHF